MYAFCTYFDKNYLLRGLTLFRSLAKYLNDFKFFIICLDDYTYSLVIRLKIPQIFAIPLSEIEAYDPELKRVKATRKLIEYYFTLTPVIPLYIVEKNPELNMITYLDADLFFYNNPQPIYDAQGENSVLIIPHRFPQHLSYLENRGRYNVQFINYKNDEIGRACLQHYKQQCLEWCYDYLEDDRYADQKYLDAWPQQFPKVKVLEHKGAGLAPWNWMQYDINIDGKLNKARVDGQELIFYHFHGLKLMSARLINHGLGDYDAFMPRSLLMFFYKNYINSLKETDIWLQSFLDTAGHFFYSDMRYSTDWFYQAMRGFYKRNLMIVN